MSDLVCIAYEGRETADEVLNELRQLQTDTTPDFLGLTGVLGPWFYGGVGEDIVIAALDTPFCYLGVWLVRQR